MKLGGGGEGIRTPDPLRAKPSGEPEFVNTPSILALIIADKKATKG